MNYCRSCGAPLLDGFRFCVSCGATVDSTGSVPESPAAEPVAPEAAVSASGLPAYTPEPLPTSEPTPAPTPEPLPAPEPAPVPAAPVRPAAPAYESEPIPAAPQPKKPSVSTLLSFDGAFVALLLFCLPGIGLITGIIWALGGARNQSRKNLARAYLLLVLALALFFGGMALLVHLIAGEQMQQFFSLLRSWLSAQ